MDLEQKIDDFLKRKTGVLLLLLYFLVVTVLMFWPIRHPEFLYYGHDMQFHLNRIEDLTQNLRNHNLIAFISTYNFNKLGIAVNVFYPNLFIYLFAGLRLIFTPVKAIYAGVFITNIATFLIAYFSYKKYSASAYKAFIFANLYGMSTYRYLDLLTRFDLGEYLALTFLPWLFLAFYELTYQKKDYYWKWLALSLAAVFYSHLITSIIAVSLMLVVFILSLNQIVLKKIFVQYLKAAGLFLLLILGFLVSFIKLYRTVPIKRPTIVNLAQHAVVPARWFRASLNNSLQGTFNLGIFAILIILCALLFYQKLDLKTRNIFMLAGGVLFLSTILFPWDYLQKTPATAIQMPWRLLLAANLLLAIVGAEAFALIKVKKVLILLLPLLILVSASSVKQFKTVNDRTPILTGEKAVTYSYLDHKMKRYDDQSYYLLVTNNHYRDYAPWPAELPPKQKLHNFWHSSRGIYDYGKNRGRVQKVKSIPNGVIMSVKMKETYSKVALPFYLYNLKNYQLLVNNKSQKPSYNGYNNLVVSLKKGKNVVQIKYVPSLLQIWALYISVISLIGLIGITLSQTISKQLLERKE